MADVRELAQDDYIAGMKYKEIAAKYKVSLDTVKSWKRRYGWNRKGCTDSRKKGAPTAKKRCMDSKKKVHTEKGCSELTAEEVQSILENSDLTDRQRLFCLYYVQSFNATRSYYKAYGCKLETAMTNGPGLLKKARIRDEIMNLKRERYSRALLEPDDIFQKYMDIAFSDITDYVEFGHEGGRNRVRLRDSSEVDGSLISEVSQGKEGAKIKLSDKMRALDWLAEHMNMATEEQKARIEKIRIEIDQARGDDKGNALADAVRRMEERKRNGGGDV